MSHIFSRTVWTSKLLLSMLSCWLYLVLVEVPLLEFLLALLLEGDDDEGDEDVDEEEGEDDEEDHVEDGHLDAEPRQRAVVHVSGVHGILQDTAQTQRISTLYLSNNSPQATILTLNTPLLTPHQLPQQLISFSKAFHPCCRSKKEHPNSTL